MFDVSERNKSLAFMILIGGRSTRFGSDKGIFEFMAKPLISYQLEIISQFNYDIFLVAHSQLQVHAYLEKIDFTQIMAFIIDDRKILAEKSVHSPMIGIYSGFKELRSLGYEKAFVLSCDMPLIKYEVVRLLLKTIKGYDCCIPRWNNGYLEPLFAIYPVNKAFEKAKYNLENEVYKLIRLLEEDWKINYIPVEKEIQRLDEKLLTFINLNGPVDLEKLIKMYSQK